MLQYHHILMYNNRNQSKSININHYMRGFMQIERKKTILDMLNNKYSVSVNELAETLFVSHATVRRDLTELAQKGLLKKVYGGAVALKGSAIEDPLKIRQRENWDKKHYIASVAADIIQNGNTVFLDSSSTVLALTENLSSINNLTVVTNGIQALNNLSNYNKTTAYCCSGKIRENTKSLVGVSAIKYISTVFADIAFISCRGITNEGILTDSSEDEIEVKRAFIKNAHKKILLIDSEKFGKQYFKRVADLSDLDIIITDTLPDKKFLDICAGFGIKIMY